MRVGFCLSLPEDPRHREAIGGSIRNESVEGLDEREGTITVIDGQVVPLEVMLGEVMVTPATFEVLRNDEVWICDTGASSHSTFSGRGGVNSREAGAATIGATGEAVLADSRVDIPGQFARRDGTLGLSAVLNGVNVNRKNNFNLLSVSKLIHRQGWRIADGDSNRIVLQKGESKIVFDIVIRVGQGAIYACRHVRTGSEEVGAASIGTSGTGVRMSVGKAHELLGHFGEDDVRATAKRLGWELTRGTLRYRGPCEECAQAKAKQRAVAKVSTRERSTTPGERISLDLTTISVKRADGSTGSPNRKNWIVLTDEATNKRFSFYSATKSGAVEIVCRALNKLRAIDRRVRYIRMDPGGENFKLEKALEGADWQSLQPIDFEYTARDTPQQNSRAEVSFPALAGRARAVLNGANAPIETRAKLSIEAISLVTLLDGLSIIEWKGEKMTRDEAFFGKIPSWASRLRTFGEAGVVKEGKNSKMGNRGETMMFVGYPQDRSSDTYRMYNPKTNSVVVTRDVTWLLRPMFLRNDPSEDCIVDVGPVIEAQEDGDVDASEKDGGQTTLVEERTEVEEAEESEDTNDTSEDTEAAAGGETSSAPAETRVSRSGRAIKPTFDPKEWELGTADLDRAYEWQTGLVTLDAERYGGATAGTLNLLTQLADAPIDEIASFAAAQDTVELALVGAGVGGGFTHANELRVLNYREAMASENAAEWKVEVENEKLRFDKFNALTPVKLSELPAGTKLLKTVWAMKRKSNGTFRGRMNAAGYAQVSGEQYLPDSISAPVTNGQSARTLMTLYCMNPDWTAFIVDVEGAFLQGRFNADEKPIFIRVPEGFERWYPGDVALRLNVPIYGTKQAAHCFYTRLAEVLREHGKLERSSADSCLFYVWHEGKLSALLSWIDDLILFGTRENVAKLKALIHEHFEAKDEGPLVEYVGCKLETKSKEGGLREIQFTQPVMVQKLRDVYKVPNGTPPKTPAVSGQELSKGSDETMKLGPLQATEYRSATATCMHAMQWTRPDIYQPTRALARYMYEPYVPHLKALQHMLHYLTGTPNRGLLLSPERLWNGSRDFLFRIRGRSDSNYAGNTDDRRSVTGGVTYLEEALVSFRSATQKYVTLSVTEAESGAGVTIVQDMMYHFRLLTSMGLKVELPMVLELDNKGAEGLFNSWSSAGRTRHTAVKLCYVRELKEQGLLVIRYVPGKHNEADLFTKNLDGPTFEKHVTKLVGHDEYVAASTGEC